MKNQNENSKNEGPNKSGGHSNQNKDGKTSADANQSIHKEQKKQDEDQNELNDNKNNKSNKPVMEDQENQKEIPDRQRHDHQHVIQGNSDSKNNNNKK